MWGLSFWGHKDTMTSEEGRDEGAAAPQDGAALDRVNKHILVKLKQCVVQGLMSAALANEIATMVMCFAGKNVAMAMPIAGLVIAAAMLANDCYYHPNRSAGKRADAFIEHMFAGGSGTVALATMMKCLGHTDPGGYAAAVAELMDTVLKHPDKSKMYGWTAVVMTALHIGVKKGPACVAAVRDLYDKYQRRTEASAPPIGLHDALIPGAPEAPTADSPPGAAVGQAGRQFGPGGDTPDIGGGGSYAAFAMPPPVSELSRSESPRVTEEGMIGWRGERRLEAACAAGLQRGCELSAEDINHLVEVCGMVRPMALPEAAGFAGMAVPRAAAAAEAAVGAEPPLSPAVSFRSCGSR